MIPSISTHVIDKDSAFELAFEFASNIRMSETGGGFAAEAIRKGEVIKQITKIFKDSEHSRLSLSLAVKIMLRDPILGTSRAFTSTDIQNRARDVLLVADAMEPLIDPSSDQLNELSPNDTSTND